MVNKHKISAYFHYLIHSGNKHSVHSPFVFKLLTTTIAPKRNTVDTSAIEKLRKKLQKDKRSIDITDFGAGSAVFKSNQRQIKQIAKYAGRNKRTGQLLVRLCHFFRPKHILELGTSIGLGTSYLASALPNTKITTIEGCKETAKVAFENFHKLGLKNIRQRIGTFTEMLPKVLEEESSQDLIFIDGHHNYQATIHYFELCMDKCHNHSVLIFNDIHWSEEMEKAWEQIKKHPKIHVTIDLFEFGLVFLRKEQVKQDFILRF